MFNNKPKSVETITAKLHSTVAELEAHADDQLAKAQAQLDAITAATSAHHAYKDEHKRATRVAANIKDLLGA